MSIRKIIQVISAIAINSWPGLNPSAGKTLYQGQLKSICVPVLNCYSCPLAWGSCPIGAFQQTLKMGVFPLFITGFFSLTGIISGRFVCGWLCPFGFLQEMLFKVRSFKLHMPRFARYIKYGVLALTLTLPFLIHQPVFCKYICPAGTVEASIWQVLMNPQLIMSIGFFFTLKYMMLFIFIAGSITYRRFFCTTLCPIGAIYGIFNKVSMLRMHVDENRCTKCGNCRLNCPMDISIYENTQDVDCIRCFECIKACPHQAVSKSFALLPSGKKDRSSGGIQDSV